MSQALHSLIGSNIVIVTMENTSFEGVLLDVKNDFLVIQKEEELEHYFSLDRIYAINKNAKDYQVLSINPNHTQKPQLIELLNDLRYNWVTVNSQTSQIMEGILNQILTDYIMIVQNEEISYLPISNISNIYSHDKRVYQHYFSRCNPCGYEIENDTPVSYEGTNEEILEVTEEMVYVEEKKDPVHGKNKEQAVKAVMAAILEEVVHSEDLFKTNNDSVSKPLESISQSTSHNVYESDMESNFESDMESGMESSFESDMESSSESGMESSFESGMESSFESGMESSFESGIQSSSESGMESSFESDMESSSESDMESSSESDMESSSESDMESSSESDMESSSESSMESSSESSMESSIEHVNDDEMLLAQYYSLMKFAEKMHPKKQGDIYSIQYYALMKNSEKMYKKLRKKGYQT